jgi:D-alanine-D-alanine ligase-like ATP-grasp enzyme
MKRSKDQGRIGVLMGGVSAEREISLRTGEAIVKALRERGYDVCPIDVRYDIAERLISEQIRVAFIALHGRFGEDGTIQGMLEVNSMPGMTETSLVPKAAHFAGIDFPELVERILRAASLKTEGEKGWEK